MQERELFTGLLHVQNAAQSQFVIFFQQGVLNVVYSLQGGQWKYVPAQDWKAELALAEGDVRVMALPVEGLRIFRIFLELEKNETHTFVSVPAEQIPAMISEWQKANTASLLHVKQQDTQAFFIISADPAFPLESLLAAPDRFQIGAAVLAHIKSWGERACMVTRLPTDLESTSGNEFILRVAFSAFVQKVLERYQELAGRFLVTHLNDALNFLNEQNHRSLYFLGTGVNHREFFMDSEQAGRTYKVLLGKMYEEMNLVIGNEIAGRIFEDALASLSPRLRQQLEMYVLAGIPFPIKLEVKQ
ncbi:MAG: hypothetical protein HY258_08030 [Chloroflexi bacterium]|nr:hypothetical protein [Chloroflexota bacterium]